MTALSVRASALRLPRWPLAVAVLAAVVAGLAGALATFSVPGTDDASPVDLVWLVSWLSFAVVGALVLSQRPENRAARAFLGVGLLVPLASLEDVLTFWVADRVGRDATVVASLRLLQDVTFAAAFALLACSVLLLPDGVLARRWMRWPARAAWLAAAALVLVGLVMPGPIGEDLPLDNPLGVDVPGLAAVEGISGLLLLTGAATGVLSLVLRARHATGVIRSQLAWLALGALVVMSVNVLSMLLDALGLDVSEATGGLLAAVLVPVVPVCVAVAVLRHNLLDVELVLRRSLLYAVLSGLVLLSYLGLTTLLGSSLDGAGPSALLGGAVALAALPLRTRGQRWLDRRFYGSRGDPYAVLSGLGRRLSATVAPDDVPALVTDAVRVALGVPWVAVEVGQVAAAAGTEASWSPLELPLLVRGEPVGRMLVAPRGPQEPLEERDVELLQVLAGQVAAAVDGVQLNEALRRSRAELVLAREEERRRLRNDLHDGLGPVLAGVALQLAVLRDAASDARVAGVLDGAQERLSGAVEDLRRLVYGLRPPALDELGLVAALRSAATAYTGLEVEVDAPDALPPLPAAVEVAAYRVAVEALTNVVRHAGVSRAAIRLRVLPESLVVEVEDPGCGVQGPAGVGRRSMAERCAEVGGVFALEDRHPGTTARAVLPLSGATS